MELFGISITRKATKVKESDKTESFVPRQNDDGAIVIGDGINNSFTQNFDVAFDSERQLINQYRDMANDPDVEWALDDIVNEALTFEPDIKTVEINLTKTDLSDKIKESIREEFEYIQRLLNFYKKGDEIFRRWYIDGRLYFHKIVNNGKVNEGIKELRYIEPTNIKKVIEEDKTIKENGVEVFRKGETYYTYSNKQIDNNQNNMSGSMVTKVLKIPNEAITYVHSGIYDPATGHILSYLHKAIKPHNQMRMLEDATAIHKIARAPSRRVFYVDVGQLSKGNAEQYMRGLMNNFKNKAVYDATTGSIKNNAHHMSMLEDIWLPRREGGRGTEVSTLDGASGFGDMEEVLYFRNKLYKALHIPLSRLEDGSTFGLGRSNEINRDEVKFAKFITKLRKKFSYMFLDILYTQLIIKKIITSADWAAIKNDVTFDFNQDSHFSELKDTEVMAGRLEQLESMNEYIGRYWSIAYIRKNILKQSEEEIEQIDKEIEEELKAGDASEYMDREAVDMGMGEEPEEDAAPAEEEKPAPKPPVKDKEENNDNEETEEDKKDKEEEQWSIT